MCKANDRPGNGPDAPSANLDENDEDMDEMPDRMADEPSTFLPNVGEVETEATMINQRIDEIMNGRPHADRVTVPWPAQGGVVNEFDQEGLFSMAFPTLFPTGSGEYLAPRLRDVRLGDYMKHLINYSDDHFARHSRFRYFALNMVYRHRALQQSSYFFRGTTASEGMSAAEVREVLTDPNHEKHENSYEQHLPLRGYCPWQSRLLV